MKFLLILLIIFAIIAALRIRRILNDRANERLGQLPSVQPPGTRNLDEETAERPEINATVLAATRAKVSQEIPDEVLKDVLLDATPQQAAKLFAEVPQDVMAGAIGQQGSGVHIEGHAASEDLAKLSNLSKAVDDLDFWQFGENKPS